MPEELAVDIAVGDKYMELVHEYPDLTIRLTLFHAAILRGQPQKIEHADIRYITAGEIERIRFCPADKEILQS
jgi:8-oxo-dGTP diphosphatase